MDSSLQFNLSLVSKTITTAVLCSRLQELQQELSKLDQQYIVRDSLATVKKELLTLIQHKDKYVRILVACCLSDILRLYAPDAPFTPNQLKSIFTLFFKQLHFIHDPSNTYFSNYFYLLDSMSSIKSVVLMADLNCDSLIVDVFQDFFEIIKPSMNQTVQVCLRDILHQLVEELSFLPSQVVDIVMNNFSIKIKKSNPAAFRLACELCTLVDDKFQRYVCQYFSDSIIASSKNVDDESQLEEFKKSHSLILQIFEHVPSLLLNVVPQLEEELKVEHATIRQIACTTLGEMFSKRGLKWMETYPCVWKGWCERRNDKVVQLRVTWIEYCGTILVNHPDMIRHVEPLLVSKLVDPDEKVRITCIEAIDVIVQDHPDLIEYSSLQQVAERCRDKKSSVRIHAIQCLASVYLHVVKQSKEMDSEFKRVSWIPGALLQVAYLDDTETTILLERVLQECIVPPLLDHEHRTFLLLQMISFLNTKQRNVLSSIFNRQAATMKHIALFIDQCAKYNSGIMDSDEEQITMVLEKLIAFLSNSFPDSKKASTQLMKFAQLNDGRLYKLFRSIMDPVHDFKTVLKYNKEISTRLQKYPMMMEILRVFITRISLYLFNKDTVQVLLKVQQNGSEWKELVPFAEQLIKETSKTFPALYQTQISRLQQMITAQADEEMVTDALCALSKHCKAFPENCPSDETTIQQLVQFAKDGNASQSKYATIILAKGGHINYIQEIFQSIVSNLELDYEKLYCQFSCLKAISFYCNEVYSTMDTEVISFIISQVLMRNEPCTASDQEWVPFEDLDVQGKVKVLGIKILLKPLLIPQQDLSSRIAFGTSFMKLLRTLLVEDGELIPDQPTNPAFKTYLRLEAGMSCLKLASIPGYSEIFETMDFAKIGLMIQDPVYHVRFLFIEQLCKCIGTGALSTKYCMWLLLAAHEPEYELKQKVKQFISRKAKKQSTDSNDMNSKQLLEHYFVEFAHMLAHHPDFSMESEDLETFQVYLKFYLETIATSENISFLYYSSAQLKMVQDKFSTDSKILYVVSEMAQVLIREHCAHNNWILQTYPGKVGITKELFTKLGAQEAVDNVKLIYLEESDFMKHRMKKPLKRTKAKIQEEEDEEDSDSTQVDDTPKKSPKLKSNVSTNVSTPIRRSERSKKVRSIA